MPNATLMIAVEGGADARRAFGQIATEHRRANAAMGTEARRASQERQRLSRADVAASQRDTRAIEQSFRRFERERTQTALRAARDRARADVAVSTARARAEREATRIAAVEARARGRVENEEVRDAVRNARAIFRARAQAETAATRLAARESALRARAARAPGWSAGSSRSTTAWGAAGAGAFGIARAGLSYAVSGAEGLHDARQSARATRAAQVRELNGAMLQTGAGVNEISAARTRIERFLLHEGAGMDFGEVVAAANQAQTRHSALAGTSAQERATRLEDFLANAREAHVMHQDVGESTAFAAMLGQQGVRGEQQRQMVGAMTQISFNGAVELGDALRQGLGPMLQYVNAQVARAPAGADRQQTYLHAMREFYAAMQAERASGNTVGWSGGRLAHLDTSLGNAHVQDLLHGRLLATVRDPAQRGRIGEMFERGADGHQALTARFRNVVNFTERMTELFGGNSERFANAMAAGGHGVPQVLQQPDVRAMRALMGTDASDPSRHVYDSIRGSFGADATMDAATHDTAVAVTRNEDAQQLAVDRETQAQALLGNTDAIKRFSDRLASYMAAHPLEAQFGGAPVSGLHMMLNEHSTEASRGAAATSVSRGWLASLAMGPLGLAIGGVRAAYQLATGGSEGQHAGASNAATLERAVSRGVQTGMQGAQITATVNPADAHIAADTNNRPRPQLGQ